MTVVSEEVQIWMLEIPVADEAHHWPDTPLDAPRPRYPWQARVPEEPVSVSRGDGNRSQLSFFNKSLGYHRHTSANPPRPNYPRRSRMDRLIAVRISAIPTIVVSAGPTKMKTNSLLQCRYKGCAYGLTSYRDVQRAQDRLSTRRRKRLHYDTPSETFSI